MIDAGLDVARINFSHGDADEHRRRARELREAAANAGRDVGLMGDLQGPKIRVQRFRERAVELRDGAAFFLDSSLGVEDGTKDGVGVALDTLHEDVEPGDMLLLNDGMIPLTVERIEGTRVHTTVINGGILSNHKGINKKGGGLSAPALTAIDRENIKLAAELEMDFLAVSFVRDGDDVREARRLFEEAGGKGLIVAKIERVEAVDEYRFDHRRCRHRHGRARRPRRRDGLRRADRHSEKTDSQDAQGQQDRHHGNADDGVDDPEPDSDAGRGLGRVECRHGRHGCRDVVGRDRGRQLSGESDSRP